MDSPPVDAGSSTSDGEPIQDGRYAGLVKKKKKGRLAQLKTGYRRPKSSSTSTLYVSETLQSPDINTLLLTIAVTIHKYTVDGQAIGGDEPAHEIFDERKYPLTYEQVNLELPDQGSVFRFIEAIFDAEKLAAECGIMMLAYIDRIREKAHVQLNAASWRRITLSTLILASKVWEDQAVWNVDFLSVFPNVSVKDLGQLEKVLLRLLSYEVTLNGKVYAKYYFDLRAIAETNERNFPLQPLTKEDVARLETRSQAEEDKYRDGSPMMTRSRSMDDLAGKSSQVVLN